MKKNKYEVILYYSGYSTHQVDAKNKEEAILKARKMKINETEILSTLENWREADLVESL